MKNNLPDTLSIRLQDVMVLYVNLYNAKNNQLLGYQDCERDFSVMLRTISERSIAMKRTELEALLWACVQQEELQKEPGAQHRFWHPHNLSVDSFIKRMLHQNQYKFYFDKIYSFFRGTKPKQGVPPESIVTIDLSKGE